MPPSALQSQRIGAPTTACPQIEKMSILVVNDDPDMRAYVKACLRSLSPGRVREASDVSGALHEIRLARPDLIIADSVMCGQEGAALNTLLKRNVLYATLPVLTITARSHSNLDSAPGEAGPVLRKPFNAAALIDAVLGLFGRLDR